MKYLSDYMEEKQTALFEELGVFFAFSGEQFSKAKVEGVKYANMGNGMFAPVDNAIAVIERMDKIHQDALKQDMEENGKDGIILRELYNHEAFHTGDISSTVDVLEFYKDITKDEIRIVYNNNYEKAHA